MTQNSTTMNNAIDQLQRAQTYAYEQSHDLDLPLETRARFANDETFLSAQLRLITLHFGFPPVDPPNWFWLEDYLKEFPMDV